MHSSITVRKYQTGDDEFLAEIYYNTIHTVNREHYTQEQLDVWAPKSSLSRERWAKKFLRTNPFVALMGDQIVGFAEFEENGHIDCFYCHHLFQGKGVGKALMEAIVSEALKKGIRRIFAEVSITAKPFFEKQGFITIKEQTVTLNSIPLTNYVMERQS